MGEEWHVYKMYCAEGVWYNVGRMLSNARDVEYCMVWTTDKAEAEQVRYEKNKEGDEE
jgi:hypothetical protein